ncbi:hypothetical protein HED55_25385 [Ochrobactrum haematophilum]|uniref:Uncharacterized protein n=1 Tax=Brucella haematophila TaxID=419474 RepID=A0ABX1DS43_9HYPH|nr:hypothetical protein [Brucella haematophila]
MIKFEPVADEVTMALNGRATGLEDTAIPLSIKTTSSDDSETFNVTISGIPDGAVITYNGEKLTVSGGTVTIVGFNNSYPMTVTPPLNSNDDFKLTVSAVSVDGTSTSAPVSRTIDVAVTGVADNAVITLPNVGYTTTEAALDGRRSQGSVIQRDHRSGVQRYRRIGSHHASHHRPFGELLANRSDNGRFGHRNRTGLDGCCK